MRSRHSQTSLRVPQHKLHLFSRHAGKPLQEVIDSRAVFEVLEQRPDWYASGFEHPFATDFSGYAFNSRTLTPIKHNTILREAGLACKHARTHAKAQSRPLDKSKGSPRQEPKQEWVLTRVTEITESK